MWKPDALGGPPWHLIHTSVAQLHYPLQRGLECLTDRPAVLLQGGPVNLSLLVVVPVAKKLLLQAQQFRSEFSAGARTFGDGCQVAD